MEKRCCCWQGGCASLSDRSNFEILGPLHFTSRAVLCRCKGAEAPGKPRAQAKWDRKHTLVSPSHSGMLDGRAGGDLSGTFTAEAGWCSGYGHALNALFCCKPPVCPGTRPFCASGYPLYSRDNNTTPPHRQAVRSMQLRQRGAEIL